MIIVLQVALVCEEDTDFIRPFKERMEVFIDTGITTNNSYNIIWK